MRVLERADAAIGEIAGELFELGARQRVVEMLGTFLIGRDERQIDGRLHDRRQLDLRLFGGFGETLHRLLVFAEIDALIAAELARRASSTMRCVVVVAAQDACRRWST